VVIGSVTDRNFVRRFYKEAFSEVLFINASLDTLIDLFATSDIMLDLDYLVIDPGDILASNRKMLSIMAGIMHYAKCNLICTAQIRANPDKGGQIYGTLDRSNEKLMCMGREVFDYSIWLRNVTEKDSILTSKYVEVYENYRTSKLKYKSIIKMTKSGGILNEKDRDQGKSS